MSKGIRKKVLTAERFNIFLLILLGAIVGSYLQYLHDLRSIEALGKKLQDSYVERNICNSLLENLDEKSTLHINSLSDDDCSGIGIRGSSCSGDTYSL